jgi:hypothetical protein
MRPLSRALPWALALGLAACGGGSGGAPSDPEDGEPPPPPASTTQVLVSAPTEEDLLELIEESGATLVSHVEGTTFAVVEIPPGEDTDDFLEDLEDDDRVDEAEHDEGVQVPEGGASTAPLFGDDLLSAVGTQPALARIGVPTARGRATGAGVRVAVIDSGLLASHPLVAGRVDPDGYDFVDGDADPTDEANGLDDDGDGRVDEGVGHGLFVASLILAVAPDARIVPLRALDSDAAGTASSVASAIGYAVSHGVDVINLSLGLLPDLSVIRQAVQHAKESGVAVIAAAGNRGQSIVNFPAVLSEVEAVTSVDDADRAAPFASFGSAVDLAAPGVDLIGAFPSPSGTARWSGTSFSTALVTGGYALLVETHPSLDVEGRLDLLEDTAEPIDALNPRVAGRLGRGRIDLGRATAP